MKRFLLIVIAGMALNTLTPEIALAFNIYRVGEAVQAREYNDVLKTWVDREFSIWVGVGSKKQPYLFFQGDTGLGDATVRVKYAPEIRNKLEHILTKAIEWSQIAYSNEADASKGLGCLGWDRHKLCEEYSSPFGANQISFTFYAANSGKQTDLVVDITDRNNRFDKATLHIDLKGMTTLLGSVKAIDSSLERAREKAIKQEELFK